MATIINSSTSNGLVMTPDTSGEIELQANGVTKAKVTANGLQDANGNSLRGGMYRNLFINSDMRIAQRGTSVTGITTSGYYTCDRWRIASNIGTFTNTQDTDVPTGEGFSYSYKLACTSTASLTTTSLLLFQQLIEGQNLQHIKKGTASAESLTLSFWVKSNKTGTHIAELYENANIRSISSQFTISTADTWEKKTITYAGDTTGAIVNNNNTGITLNLWLTTGTNYSSGTLATSWGASIPANRAVGQNINLADSTSNYINITGVQLEVGSGASDFEFLPYDVQLARCQRYCVNLLAGTSDAYGVFMLGQNNASTQVRGIITSPSQMRVSPSIEYGGSFQAQGGWGDRDVTAFSTTGRTGSQYMEIIIDTLTGLTGGNASQIRRKNDATAYFRLTAEL